MNEIPAPFSVSATRNLGRSGAACASRSSEPATAAMALPSQRHTAQPYAAAHARQHRVQPRGVVALAREVAVLPIQDLEMEPGEDVHAAEARADMPRARPGDHVQGVDAASVAERSGAVDGIRFQLADAFKFL